MKGWHTQVAGVYEKPTGVIGVVVAPKFPDLDIIREKIREGIEKRPNDVWVIREKPQKDHAVNVVWDTLTEAGIEPFHVPLVPAFKRREKVEYRERRGKGGRVVFLERMNNPEYDLRRRWADAELASTCERVIVFHDKSSQVTAGWADTDAVRTARVFVIERGKKKPVKRKTGKKPIGS